MALKYSFSHQTEFYLIKTKTDIKVVTRCVNANCTMLVKYVDKYYEDSYVLKTKLNVNYIYSNFNRINLILYYFMYHISQYKNTNMM